MPLIVTIAVKRILRTPGVSVLVIGALAIGVGLFMPMVTLYYNISGNPMAEDGEITYRVLVGERRDVEGGSLPAIKMETDLALKVMSLFENSRKSVSYSSFQNIRNVAGVPNQRPMFTEIRVTTRDFFNMFGAPVRYGSIWSDVDDRKINNVAVLGYATNLKLFGGKNSVGQQFRIGDDEYTVVGVLNQWPLVPRIYDIGRTGNAKSEGVFVPLSSYARTQLTPYDFSFVAGDQAARERGGHVEFTTFWVQLIDAHAVRHAEELLRDLTNDPSHDSELSWALYSANEWVRMSPDLENRKRMYRAFILVNLCFLCVCLFNLLSLLMAKVFSQASETSLLRALGASRTTVFAAYLVEVTILGLVGTALSVFISKGVIGGLYWLYVDNLPTQFRELQTQEGTELIYAQVDLVLLVMTLATGLLGALLSVLVPAMRASQIQLAEHLRTN